MIPIIIIYIVGQKHITSGLTADPYRVRPEGYREWSGCDLRRDTREKYTVTFDELVEKVQEILETIQKDMLERARKHRDPILMLLQTMKNSKILLLTNQVS